MLQPLNRPEVPGAAARGVGGPPAEAGRTPSESGKVAPATVDRLDAPGSRALAKELQARIDEGAHERVATARAHVAAKFFESEAGIAALAARMMDREG